MSAARHDLILGDESSGNRNCTGVRNGSMQFSGSLPVMTAFARSSRCRQTQRAK
jgi:hypothetical protein